MQYLINFVDIEAMAHEIAPDKTYISPHLKESMLKAGLFISHYEPGNLDAITSFLNVPAIENKAVLLRKADSDDTFTHPNTTLTVSIRPNALNPDSPQYLTRTIGKAILIDPQLNPNYRVPKPSFEKKDLIGILSTCAIGAGLAFWGGANIGKESSLPLEYDTIAGFGSALALAGVARYSYKFILKPMLQETYDEYRLFRLGQAVESPLTIQKVQ